MWYNVCRGFVLVLKTEVETSNVDLDWYSRTYHSYSVVLRGQGQALEFESLTARLLPNVGLGCLFAASV